MAGSLTDIVPAMQANIIKFTGLPPNRVQVAAFNAITDVPHTTAEHDVVIRIGSESREHDALEGAGRVDDRRNRHIEIYCRARSSQDKVGSDQRKLLDKKVGLIQLEDQVADALEIFMTPDATGSFGLNFPIYLEGPTAPQHDSKEAIEWVWSRFDCTVMYVRNLNQNFQ